MPSRVVPIGVAAKAGCQRDPVRMSAAPGRTIEGLPAGMRVAAGVRHRPLEGISLTERGLWRGPAANCPDPGPGPAASYQHHGEIPPPCDRMSVQCKGVGVGRTVAPASAGEESPGSAGQGAR